MPASLRRADQRRIVFLSWRVGGIQRLLLAQGVGVFLGLVRNAFSVGRIVMQDRDLLVLELSRQRAAGHLALLVVAAAGAKGVPPALVGELGIGRGRSDLEDRLFGVDLARRNRSRRAVMPGDERDMVAREFLRHGHRLRRVAGVVPDLEDQFLAEHAASGVDVGDGLFRPGLHLRPEARVFARERTGDRDMYLGAGRRCGQRDRNRCCHGACRQKAFQHGVPP